MLLLDCVLSEERIYLVFTFVFPLLCTICLLHGSVKIILQHIRLGYIAPVSLKSNLRATGFQEELPCTSGLAGCTCSDINIAHSSS